MTPATLDDLFGLRGRRALVTGASAGLGVELAEALAIAGADVALVARRQDRLAEVARSLAPHGVRTAIVAADLTAAGAPAAVLDEAESALGPIDILVNNAGRHLAVRAEKTTSGQWRSILDLNLDVVFAMSRELARRRLADGTPARIVNLGSVLGTVASSTPGLAAYVASKGAISALTKQLAIEWGRKGITVNEIAPAYFPTELNEKDFGDPKIRERIEAFTPLGRLGRPGELRTALLFLVAPGSGYVNGTTVFVDGGYTAW